MKTEKEQINTSDANNELNDSGNDVYNKEIVPANKKDKESHVTLKYNDKNQDIMIEENTVKVNYLLRLQ